MNTIIFPWTARSYLFGASGTESITASLREGLAHSSIDRLSKVGRKAVTHQLASMVNEMLDIDLISVLAAAWRTHDKLVDAGKRTAAAPGTDEVVELGTHTITSVHKPAVELVLDGRPAGKVHFELDFTCGVIGAVGTVRGGALISIGLTQLDLEGRLDCEGVELVRKRAKLQLPGRVGLGDGYRLLAPGVMHAS
jgi:hypothetical protein